MIKFLTALLSILFTLALYLTAPVLFIIGAYMLPAIIQPGAIYIAWGLVFFISAHVISEKLNKLSKIT